MNVKLYYWPIPFRGNFIRLLLEDANATYTEASPEETVKYKTSSPEEQPFPAMAPPFLHDLDDGVFLSQMPTIVMYLSEKLNYLPKDAFKSAVCLKLLLDSNDVLAEITNSNGSTMWEYEIWKPFRQKRLKRWFEIFEQTALKSGLQPDSGFMWGDDQISTADIVLHALFGTMTRCLPELSVDFQNHAPRVFTLCQRMEERPKIKQFIESQSRKYEKQYCGGQIEQSIRRMLELDLQHE